MFTISGVMYEERLFVENAWVWIECADSIPGPLLAVLVMAVKQLVGLEIELPYCTTYRKQEVKY